MHTGARRPADPALVHDTARAKSAAPAAPAPAEHIGDATAGLPVSPAATARGDALDGILARAVAQRAHDAGVVRHDVGATLQRRIKTKASDLDKHVSTSQTVKGAFGKTSESTRVFAAIRDALSLYQSVARKGKSDLATQAQQLGVLDDLCTRFLNQHGTGKRRAIVDRLFKQINKERRAVSQLQAQQIYQENVKSSKQPVGANETDPGKTFGFKALSSEGRKAATKHDLAVDPGNQGPKRPERIKTLQQDKGLTDAEISAISIFSTGDFTYINPVTANPVAMSWENEVVNPWLVNQRKGNSDDAWTQLDDQTIKEEGSLHTAVALKGLLKMDVYPGETYRGARFTPEAFKGMGLAAGKTMPFGTLTSSSKVEKKALNFVYGLASGAVIDASKSVAVFYILTDHGGRDISDIALVRKEAEVLLLPGSVFEVASVQELNANVENTRNAKHVERAVKGNEPLPTSWYVVRLALSKKPASVAPSRPRTAPWTSARSQPAAYPTALPQRVSILGEGHRGA